ncbi:MAG: class I SAM-dependent methyltransferase [Acidobacteriota bacterium]
MRREDYETMHHLETTFWWFEGMRDIVQSLLSPEIQHGPDSFLDVGCGTGIMLHWFPAQFHPKLMAGCDLSEVAIGFCRQTIAGLTGWERTLNRSGLLLTRGSVLQLPFQDASFDVVTNLDVLDSMPLNGGDLTALRELHRVLRPGGVALIRAPAYNWLLSGHDRNFESVHRFSVPELAGKMERVGFRVTRRTYANSILFPLALVRRLLRKIGIANQGTDTQPWPPALQWVNAPMTACLRAEARALRSGFNLPFGLSAICIGKKVASRESRVASMAAPRA